MPDPAVTLDEPEADDAVIDGIVALLLPSVLVELPGEEMEPEPESGD